MAVRIVSKTSAQKLQQFPILPRRVTVQPHTWYICPIGKKALVVGSAQCTGTGGGTQADVDILPLGITKYRWFPGPSAQVQKCNWNPLGLSANNFAEVCPIRIELAAGESIQTNQNLFTNAEFNLDLEVFESDV